MLIAGDESAMPTISESQTKARELADATKAYLADHPQCKPWDGKHHEFSDWVAEESPKTVVEVAIELWKTQEHKLLWAAYSILYHHPTAFHQLRYRVLERIGSWMHDWGSVDVFCSLAGPAWREGQISDKRITIWAHSKNRWWRRASLVNTVFLNRKTVGGYGDVDRTLAVCKELVMDRDDMVVKAMSWALRELIPHDRLAVETFLEEHEDVLASRVKREVRNKLETGLKNPRRK